LYNRICPLEKHWTKCISVAGDCVDNREVFVYIYCCFLCQATNFLNGLVRAGSDVNVFCLIFYSALEKIILNGYLALGLMYFFTVGEDEVKAWTVQVGHTNTLSRLYVCYMQH